MDPGGGDDEDPACKDWSELDKKNFVIWQSTAGDENSEADFTKYLVSCDKKAGKILDYVQHGLHSLQRLSDFCADNPCFDLKELVSDIYSDRVQCDTFGDANQMIREFVFGGLSLIDNLKTVTLNQGDSVCDNSDLSGQHVVKEDVATVVDQKEDVVTVFE